MKKAIFEKLKSTAMLIALIAGLCFMTANFTAQTVKAQSSLNNGSGPQDGGDGKKKPVRPPTRPTLAAQTTDQPATTQVSDAGEDNSVNNEISWLEELYNWIFG